MSQQDPHRTVQAFIDLVQRHESSFYDFVHKVHSKGEGLFDSLMRWIELFITLIREGTGSPLSLDFLLPHMGQERTNILEEVDKVALYHYKLKVIYEDKVRRRFGRVGGTTGADDEREVEQMVDGVVGELNFGDLVSGEVQDLAAEDTDSDETESSDEEEEETTDEEGSTEDETTEEDESSEDDDARRTPVRQRTITQTPNTSTPTTPRPRSLSLRGSRSSLFSDMKQAMSRRKEEAPPVPPLPPLPLSRTSTLSAAVNKPLPPSPAKQSFDSARSAPVSRLGQSSSTPIKKSFDSIRSAPPRIHTKGPTATTRKARRKKAGEKINPPDLEHIPKLLPLFKEMVRRVTDIEVVY